MIQHNAVRDAIQAAGGQAALARLITRKRGRPITTSSVNQWASGARGVPVEHMAMLEQASGGTLMRWDMRPLDWWLIWPELMDRSDAPQITTQEAANAS